MTEPSFVTVNWMVVEKLMKGRGLTIEPLSQEVALSLATLKRWKAGEQARPSKVLKLAKFFAVNVQTLYKADAFTTGASHPATGTVEWESQEYLNQQRLTPNGLCVVVCRLKHRHIPERQARGKYYPLGAIPTGQRDQLQQKLVRHSEVCCRLPPHPNIARNLSTNFGESKNDWWVIDEWVGESLLLDLVQEAPLDSESFARILTGVTAGLLQLHAASIIFRELAPNHVLLRDDTQEPVLTDFELARLLHGSHSVSTEWQEDLFRAPEVDSGVFDLRADYYSLARLAVYCVGGDWEAETGNRALWAQTGMPKRVIQWLERSLSPVPDDRPGTASDFHAELQKWKDRLMTQGFQNQR